MNDREWYYLLNNEKTGPLSMAELRELAGRGQLKPQDSVWKAGMAQWAPAQTVPDLFTSPPPPPHSPHASPVHVHVSAPMTPQKSSTLKWVLIGGVLLIGGCCGIPGMIMVLSGLGHKVQQDEQSKKVVEAKDAIAVSAPELFQAFKNNEVDANNKYKGKVVEVAGTVHAVKERYVELDEDNSRFLLGLVHVTLDRKSKDKMGTLNKGQSIKVRGVCTGKSFASVNIENAVLVD